MIEVKMRKLSPEAVLPRTWSDQACGYDLHALLLDINGRANNAMVAPGATRNLDTGIAIECPRGYFAMVMSRSGLAKESIFVANSPGIIDPDYRGEIKVLLHNSGWKPFYVKNGDRIAQLVFAPFVAANVREVQELSDTVRGSSGIGSTGV